LPGASASTLRCHWNGAAWCTQTTHCLKDLFPSNGSTTGWWGTIIPSMHVAQTPGSANDNDCSITGRVLLLYYAR